MLSELIKTELAKIEQQQQGILKTQETILKSYQQILEVLNIVQSNTEQLTARVDKLEQDIQTATTCQEQLELLQQNGLKYLEQDTSFQELLNMLESLKELANSLEWRYSELSNRLNSVNR